MDTRYDFRGKRILVAGASSDMATELVPALAASGATLGLHYHTNRKPLEPYRDRAGIMLFSADLSTADAARNLVDAFVSWAGGIDGLVQLTGDIRRPVHWSELSEEDWRSDLWSNMVIPFSLARAAVGWMGAGGRVVLTSTASAAHGGGATSLAYGVAKAGVECIVKRLARDSAAKNIRVNAVAPGFITTKFHTARMGRTPEQLADRARLVPMQRAGTTGEVAGAFLFLLSDQAAYMTGQVITVSGGDFL